MGKFSLPGISLFLACTTQPTPASEPVPTSTPASIPTLALPPPPPAIRADLHLDTPTQLHRKKVNIQSTSLEASLPRLKQSGINLAVEVLWPPREANWPAIVDALFSHVEAQDKAEEALVLVRSPTQARVAAAAGQVGMLVNIEGAHALMGVADLQKWYDRGLRMLGLTWSFSNIFAGSSSDSGTGLTKEGQALVAEANRLGVILDLSHASRETTIETCNLSSKPVIASHSNAYAVHAQKRNLNDKEIQCICSKGGVIGLNLHAPFLGGTRDALQAVKHVEHIRQVGGPGCVALGSDFDGLIEPPADIQNEGELAAIDAIFQNHGWSEEERLGFFGENFIRVWDAVTTR